jgi:hypothetical protein
MAKQRNQSNTAYPKNWRLRKRGERGDYVISFRAPQDVRHLWGDKAEPELGRGSTIAAAEKQAYQEWQRRIIVTNTPMTMGQLIDRYVNETIPAKAPATQISNTRSIKRLRSVIDPSMPVNAFKTHMAYQYRDRCAQLESNKKANLDLEALSHMFTKAFEWGCDLIEHPIKGKVQKISIPPRDRYVEDWEYDCLLSVCAALLTVYLPLKLATGKDQSILLSIQLSDIKEDGLYFPKRRKIKENARAKKSMLPFYNNGESTGLKEIIDNVLEWRRTHLKVGSIYLFATSQGQPYIKPDGKIPGFSAIWQRTMAKALKETALEIRFTEHDLCAKTASDVETVEQAAQLRGHLQTSTTEKVYRRKPNRVIPLNRSTK